MIKDICLKKIEDKNLDEKYIDRLNLELVDLEEQNAINYFEELYEKCKSQNLKLERNENNLLIPYLLGITDDFNINDPPLYVYGDWPDIDIDFLPEVQKYLKNEWAPKFFGDDYVCNIATYNTLGIKQAVQDIARVYSLDRGEIVAITTSMADKDDDGNPLTWDKAIELYPEFADYCKRYPEVASAAKLMIHRNKAKGVHPGGIIISGVKLTDFVPIETDKNGIQVSAWPEGLHTQDLQPVGLIKFDLLVVKNNKQVAKACDLIKKRYGLKSICAIEGMPDWSDESYLNDPKAIEMADKGDLKGVFQFDSEGIRNVVKKSGVNSFEDLVALTALYRPGPMSMLMDKTFANRKRGVEAYKLHPVIEPILSRTYGVMVYQEQVMQILNKVGLIPLKDCETVRKAISKKKIDKFIQYKNMFIENGQKVLGFSKEQMEEFWNQIEAFAGYGFNRCLSSDTLLFNKNNNKYLEIADAVNYVDENSITLDCYTNGKLITDVVEDVFEVGEEELYEVELNNGFIFKCTMQHKFICVDGNSYELEEILSNDLEILCIDMHNEYTNIK